jgi:uncharacterized protein YjeT (DUF2065 family)
MGQRLWLAFGILLVIGGIALLIHPRLRFRTNHREVRIGSVKAIEETSRILLIPRVAGALIVGSGLLLAASAIRK